MLWKKWFIAFYKSNEVKRLQYNLLNQNFDYYLPKITTKKINSRSREELLFPGYIFVNTSFEKYSALKHTIGIINILKFGDNIPSISNEDIKIMQVAEENSKKDPVATQIQIGQDAIVSSGSLKGSMVKITSLPSKNRVDVFLTFLGSKRIVNIPKKDLTFWLYIAKKTHKNIIVQQMNGH